MNDAIDNAIQQAKDYGVRHGDSTVTWLGIMCVLQAMKTPEPCTKKWWKDVEKHRKVATSERYNNLYDEDGELKDNWERIVAEHEGCPLWDREKGCTANKLDKLKGGNDE